MLKRLLVMIAAAAAVTVFSADRVKDPETLFLLSFDRLDKKNDPTLEIAEEKDLKKEKQAAAPKQSAEKKGEKTEDGGKGEIEFDYKPFFNKDTPDRTAVYKILSARDKRRGAFSVGVNSSNGGHYLWFNLSNQDTPGNYGIYQIMPMEKDKWHRINISWDENFFRLYMNGQLAGKKEIVGAPPMPSELILGDGGRLDSSEALIDNLRFSDAPPRASRPGLPVTIETESGDTETTVSRYEDNGRSVFFVLENPLGPVRVTVAPKKFPVTHNERYSVLSTLYTPRSVWAVREGALTFDAPKTNRLAFGLIKSPGENLVVNPSFEDRKDGVPSGWTFTLFNADTTPLFCGTGAPLASSAKQYPAAEDCAAVSATIWKDGGRSVRLTKMSPRLSVTCASGKDIILEAGAEYMLSGYYHTEDLKFGSAPLFGVRLRAQGKPELWFGDDDLSLVTPSGKDEWGYSFVGFRVPDDYKDATAKVEISASGALFTIFWDEIELSKAAANIGQPSKALSAAQKKPVLSADEVRRMTAGMKAPGVKIERVSEQPLVMLDGKPLPLLGFSPGPSDWPAGGAHKDFAEAGVHLHLLPVAAGLDGACAEPGKPFWLADGKYDFSELDSRLATLAGLDPEARVILHVYCGPYSDFISKHPESARDVIKAGSADTAEAPAKRYSILSESYRAEAAKAMRALGAHLAKSGLGKLVIGAHLVNGRNRNWKNSDDNTLANWPEDVYPVFAKWLKTVYGDSKSKLREAWGEESSEFSGAAASLKDVKIPEGYFMSLSGPGRKIVDVKRFRNERTAEVIDSLSSAFKAGLGRGALVTVQYSAAMRGGSEGNGALKKLLESASVDGIVCSPNHGEIRLPGQASGNNALAASVRARNKLFISELDYRTEYSRFASDEEKIAAGTVSGYDAVAAIVRRDVGYCLSQGAGAWIYCSGGNAFNNPMYMTIIPEALKAARMAAEKPASGNWGQIAVFWDEELFNFAAETDNFASNLAMLSGYSAARTLSLSGLSWDAWLLSDIDNPNRPKYKINIFPASLSLTEKQASWIKDYIRNDGSAVIFTNAVGAGANPDIHEMIKSLTGVDASMKTDEKVVYNYSPRTFDDPLAAPVNKIFGSMSGPLIQIGETKANFLAGYYHNGDTTAAAVMRNGDWTGVYTAVPGGFTPGLLAALAKELNVTPLCAPGDVVFAGNNFICVHAVTSGDKTVSWGTEKSDLFDIAAGETAVKNAVSHSFKMTAGETKWFRRLPGPAENKTAAR